MAFLLRKRSNSLCMCTRWTIRFRLENGQCSPLSICIAPTVDGAGLPTWPSGASFAPAMADSAPSRLAIRGNLAVGAARALVVAPRPCGTAVSTGEQARPRIPPGSPARPGSQRLELARAAPMPPILVGHALACPVTAPCAARSKPFGQRAESLPAAAEAFPTSSAPYLPARAWSG